MGLREDKAMGARLRLRKAEPSDCMLLFDWVNEADARKSAFDGHTIGVKEHRAWFGRMMDDPNQAQFILLEEGIPIGQARLAIEGAKAEIDYSISSAARGRGLGREIIRLLIREAREEYPQVKKLVGRIKPSNAASYDCLMKNGFEEAYRQLEYDF